MRRFNSHFLYCLLGVCLLASQQTFAQGNTTSYQAGFMTLALTDSGRAYKPSAPIGHGLHHRPVELDIWYPSLESKTNPLRFSDLFQLFESRATKYQEQDYGGLTTELAQLYVSELGLGTDGDVLLDLNTQSYEGLEQVPDVRFPLVVYMAGFNGMGFENYRILQNLAQQGYVVVSIWSVGRYPGDMTNELGDTMEQVYDAEFALDYVKHKVHFNIDTNRIGVLGTSWGGMAAAVLVGRNPSLKAFVSFDGSETHYFGAPDDNVYANGADGEANDRYIGEIHRSGLLKPETQRTPYLYLESGDKLDGFSPTAVYRYSDLLQCDNYYLRFPAGKHEDFICIPAALGVSDYAVRLHDDISMLALRFFDKYLNASDSFDRYWREMISRNDVSIHPYTVMTPEKKGEAIRITGTVIDAKTGEPLPYVNVGILERETGTVSNQRGRFELIHHADFMADIVRVSTIGYKPVYLPLADIVADTPVTVKLDERMMELDEVLITAKGIKRRTLGNKSESRFISTGFRYDQLGAEMGIKINVRRAPVYVDSLRFSIAHNRLSGTAIFRLNFYSIANGKPSENISRQHVFVAVEPKQIGLISVDLHDHNIVLQDDVIVTLEWVETAGDNKEGEAIFFSTGLIANGTFYKPSSQANFRKYRSLGVGLNLDVRY